MYGNRLQRHVANALVFSAFKVVNGDILHDTSFMHYVLSCKQHKTVSWHMSVVCNLSACLNITSGRKLLDDICHATRFSV